MMTTKSNAPVVAASELSDERAAFEAWWAKFTDEHDEWPYADASALRWAAFQAGTALAAPTSVDGLLVEIAGLASLGSSYGLTADGYCNQIHEIATRARAVLAAATPAASVLTEEKKAHIDRYLQFVTTVYPAAEDEIAYLLACELEDAELSANDLVTVNREKLRHIARRVLVKAREGAAPAVQQPAECGWIANTGAQPVADGVKVDVEFRYGGDALNAIANEWDWTIDANPGDILRWRPAAPTQAEGHSHD